MTGPGRVALVTGGGTGIGAAVARRLAAGRVAVAIVGRRRGPLEEIAQSIEAAGGTALTLPDDLADPEAPGRIARAVRGAWGRIDVLVNNAGAIRNLPIEEMTVELFDHHVAVNVRAPFLLAQAVLPDLAASGSGAIVNISSSSASLSIPGQAVYGLTKAALEYLTKSWAAEFAPRAIRVNCIAPGPVDTPIHLSWASDMEAAYSALRDASPLGRVGDPDDIARLVEWLSDPRQTFVTGAVIPVDGGQTLNGWASAIAGAAATSDESEAGQE